MAASGRSRHNKPGTQWPVRYWDEFTVANTLRQNGRIALRNTTVLSPDGKAFVVVKHGSRRARRMERLEGRCTYERQE